MFTPAGVRFLVDTDPHYHVLRAERLLHGDPNGLWTDANMDAPVGARILWPPGFDALLAAAVRLVAGPDASRAQVERVAAFVPAILGVIALALVAAMAVPWVGWGAALLATLLAAILPIQVEYGLLGRPDQHVAELVVFGMILLAFERAVARGWRGWIAVLAVALAAAPWTWQGSAMYAAFLALFAGAVHVLRPDGVDADGVERTLAVGALAGAVLLAASLVAWTPPDAMRPRSLAGVSAFDAALLAAVAAYAGLLVAGNRLAPSAGPAIRLLAAALAGALPAAILVFAFREPILHGLRSVAASDAWLSTISEFQPLFFGKSMSLQAQFFAALWNIGPVLLAPLLAARAFARRWRAAPQARTGLALLAAGAAVFLVLTLRAARFRLYLGPFAVVAAALLVRDLLGRREVWRPRTLGAAGGMMLLFALPVSAVFLAPLGSVDEDSIALLGWLRSQRPDGRTVLAPWTLGHAIQYYAAAPVVATPFGTDVGPDGMRDLSAFLYATTADEANAIAERRRAGFLLLGEPLGTVANAFGLLPRAEPLVRVTRDLGSGRRLSALPAYPRSVPARFYHRDAVPGEAPDGAALARWRMVYEAPYRGGPPLKLFERVAGVAIQVTRAVPGAPVTAEVPVRTNQGRRFTWWTRVPADATGGALLRVPYATGANGAVTAGRLSVRAPALSAEVDLPEAALRDGAALQIALDRGR